MSAYLSPIAGAGWQFFTNSGVVLSGGQIFTYLAGSTMPQATWTNSAQTVQNANPIILGSDGRPPNEVWLASGSNNYKFVLADSMGVTLGTWDNITGIAASNSIQSEWIAPGFVITYISPTKFSAPGDQSALYSVNRRVQYFLGAGVYYGSVISNSVALGVTTVTITPDSTPLNSTLSAVNYSFISATNSSIPANYIKQGDAINGSTIGLSTPAAGAFTTLTSPNVTITGGTITGIAGFSVPDFLLINQGII